MHPGPIELQLVAEVPSSVQVPESPSGQLVVEHSAQVTSHAHELAHSTSSHALLPVHVMRHG
ncbi:MAG TPA: hypothetical protein VFQ53_28260, partial [Kofleriaceae bacterium]|nr:hypothetical protein [Kofleriaceae bacterium]